MKPAASIIILNWNGREFNKNCLDSIYSQSFKDFEVIFVDNASSDDSVKYIKWHYPKAKVIVNKQNLGYSAGNNVGIRAAKGDFILILNNDTVLDRNFLKSILKPMQKSIQNNKNNTENHLGENNVNSGMIGMVSPKALFMDGSIDTLGHKLYKSGLAWDIKSESEINCLFTPCGCAVLYRKTALDEIKIQNKKMQDEFLDEDFYMYAEDLDLGMRLLLAGWHCAYAKDAIIHHIHGGSSNKIKDHAVYYGRRNELWAILKNFPLSTLLKCSPYIAALQIGEFFKYARIGKLTPLFRSKLASIAGIPKMLRKRRIIQKNRKISAKDFEKKIVPAMLPK